MHGQRNIGRCLMSTTKPTRNILSFVPEKKRAAKTEQEKMSLLCVVCHNIITRKFDEIEEHGSQRPSYEQKANTKITLTRYQNYCAHATRDVTIKIDTRIEDVAPRIPIESK